MRSRNALILGLALLLALGWWLVRPNPKLAKARVLQQELFSDAGRQLPDAERRRKWEEFRSVAEGLAPEQRRELRNEMFQRFDQQVLVYVRSSPQEKVQQLDQMIERDLRRQQQAQARGNGGAGPGAALRGPRGGGGAQANLNPAPGGDPASRGKARTFEDREKRRKDRLDQSTPEARAARDILARDLAARRKARGLPERGFGGRGGPR